MTANPAHATLDLAGLELPPDVLPALALLLEAHDCAAAARRTPWDFAVEIHVLRTAGLTRSQLRLLACRSLVQHALEITLPTRQQRTFTRPGRLLALSDRTCAVLTPAGVVVARANPPAELDRLARPLVAFWEAASRTLRLGPHVVKRFRQSAPNQECLLAVFQELGWPFHIDDPLPGRDGQDAQDRLRETVKNLNRYLESRLLRFRVDSTGEGVTWELVRPGAR